MQVPSTRIFCLGWVLCTYRELIYRQPALDRDFRSLSPPCPTELIVSPEPFLACLNRFASLVSHMKRPPPSPLAVLYVPNAGRRQRCSGRQTRGRANRQMSTVTISEPCGPQSRRIIERTGLYRVRPLSQRYSGYHAAPVV